MKETLFGKTLAELEEIVRELEMPRYVARQLVNWLYKNEADSFEQMTDISLANRQKLNDRFVLGIYDPTRVQVSSDGTKKYLFAVGTGKYIESAYIPEKDRATLCVSSQVGCKMGCLFCMTGKQGFQANLSAGEILNQVRSLPERKSLTNIVYMGMGEPFDNTDEVMKSIEILTSDWGYGWSSKRITVSTIGIIPGMKRFLEESQCHLAVSLHSPFEEERRRLMPIENVYSLHEVLDFLKSFDLSRQRRISFEYIMFRDINDTPRHVKELARILNGLRCRINLIRFHPIPNTPLKSSDEKTIEQFMVALNKKGIRTTIRASRGQDIQAACGLLSTREMVKKTAPDY